LFKLQRRGYWDTGRRRNKQHFIFFVRLFVERRLGIRIGQR
jgi:hypothetical protein